MTKLTDLSLVEALEGLGRKDFTALELTDAYIAAMEASRPLNIFVTETPDKAREMAREADARIASGGNGPLDGIPIAVKDLYCSEGVKTQAASRILDGFVPPYESTVTANLWKAGAVHLGKVNMDEFAMGSATTASVYGPTVNPWKEGGDPNAADLVSGGSSGGSAAAVAARAALAATASDTGGSIRQPASFTGTVGIKPTYGRCSRWGMVAFASSLDQAGPVARTVEDTAVMLGAMAGHDPKDSTSVDMPVPDYRAAVARGVKGLRIGIPKEYRADGMTAEVDTLWSKGVDWLKAAGAEVVDISLPHTKYALPAYYIIANAEASANLARYDGVRFGLRVPGETLDEMYENTRGAGFGPEVKRRILTGTYVLSAGYYDAYYLKAQKVRARVADDFREAFETVDTILAPATPTPAFPIGQNEDDPVAMYLNDVFTVPINLAGLPSISVPAGLTAAGLPLGLQLIGKPFDEETVFAAARIVEEGAGFSAKPAFRADV